VKRKIKNENNFKNKIGKYVKDIDLCWTSPISNVNIINPIMSSITAAPRIVAPTFVLNFPISMSVLTLTATAVIDKAIPRKRLSRKDS